jgi:16S rRNA (guanine527-N7)-methyltransferase
VNPRELLREGVHRLGIPASAEQLERLERFRAELERWNRVYGFVKAEGEELVVRHFLDSLAALPVLQRLEPRCSLLDVGSGAGFPGVPLAIVLADTAVTLLERSARRAAFLRNVCVLLALNNASVAEAQLRELKGCYDLVSFRAFSPLQRELSQLKLRVSDQGWIAAYKGRKDRLEAEIAAAGLGPGEFEVHALEVPFLGEERHLLLVRGPRLL